MSKRSIVIVAALSLFTAGNATVWYIHPDSTMNCIQYGLDSCSAGDTVLVGPGTYHENIVWPATDGIDLISENGPVFTIIDGDSAGRVIDFAANVDTTTNIDGFTIRDGYSEQDGAAIHCNGASPSITGNIITNNRVYGGYNGGAIACMNNASPDIHANSISNNRSTWGGGILCYNMSMPNITDNTIDNNYADSVGGGITCYGGCDANITDNTITNNGAYWGGGIAIADYSSPTVRRNTISANDAAWMGGGIYCYRFSTPLIEDNEVLDNDCNFADYGAGIRCSSSGNAVIKHCRISNNELGISIHGQRPISIAASLAQVQQVSRYSRVRILLLVGAISLAILATVSSIRMPRSP